MNNNDGFEDRTDIQGAKTHADPSLVQNEVDNSEWRVAHTRGRWSPFWNGRTYNPPQTPARKKARQQKQAWARLDVPLHLCMTGDELIAERARTGDGTSFENPRTDEARALVALLPHGRLRRVECMLLVALSYAMLQRRRHGLVATLRELGVFVGLRETATSEAMSRLIALGFVRADATFTRYGACESQRGNLWRLTSQCVAAFALRDVPDGVGLPTGTVDEVRLARRRRCPGIATPRNPEANQDALCAREKTKSPSGMAPGPAGAVVSRSASPTSKNFRTAVANAAVGRSQPVTRQAETCNASLRLRTEQGSRSVVEELAELVADPVLRAAILAARKGGAS